MLRDSAKGANIPPRAGDPVAKSGAPAASSVRPPDSPADVAAPAQLARLTPPIPGFAKRSPGPMSRSRAAPSSPSCICPGCRYRRSAPTPISAHRLRNASPVDAPVHMAVPRPRPNCSYLLARRDRRPCSKRTRNVTEDVFRAAGCPDHQVRLHDIRGRRIVGDDFAIDWSKYCASCCCPKIHAEMLPVLRSSIGGIKISSCYWRRPRRQRSSTRLSVGQGRGEKKT